MYDFHFYKTDDRENIINEMSTMKKPIHSMVGRLCTNKGIAKMATKSGSEQESTEVLAAPINLELSKKIT